MFYANAIMGIITIVLFSIIISKINTNSKLFKTIMDFHYWFGRNSFYIMSTHVPIKGILIVIMATLTHKSNFFIVNDYFYAAIVFAATCALSSLASIIVIKIKKHDEAMVQKMLNRN